MFEHETADVRDQVDRAKSMYNARNMHKRFDVDGDDAEDDYECSECGEFVPGHGGACKSCRVDQVKRMMEKVRGDDR